MKKIYFLYRKSSIHSAFGSDPITLPEVFGIVDMPVGSSAENAIAKAAAIELDVSLGCGEEWSDTTLTNIPGCLQFIAKASHPTFITEDGSKWLVSTIITMGRSPYQSLEDIPALLLMKSKYMLRYDNGAEIGNITATELKKLARQGKVSPIQPKNGEN